MELRLIAPSLRPVMLIPVISVIIFFVLLEPNGITRGRHIRTASRSLQSTLTASTAATTTTTRRTKNGKARKFVDCVAHPLADEKRGILSS